MNKKTYITPVVEQTTMELGNMLAASEKVSVFSNADDAVGADASLSNKRRGGWGDLWE